MSELALCPWEASEYLFFSSNVPQLLYYSHFTAILASLIITIFILLKDRNSLTSRFLLSIFTLFMVWAFSDMVQWATNEPGVSMLWWSISVLIEPIIYALAFYLFYVSLYSDTPSKTYTVVTALLLLPLIVLAPTTLNISAVNTFDCTALEGPLAQYYTYVLEIFFILSIVFYGAKRVFSNVLPTEKRKTILLALGLLVFLAAFSSGNIIGSMTGDWELAQYGLFGMPIFIGFLAYLIVQYKIYNLQLLGAQALVLTLWVLIGSLLFVAQSLQTRIVAAATLLLSVVFGIFLVKSVKRTVKQKEEIEKLAQDLRVANDRLKELDRMKSEFVSIASHQLRSPLTSIRGYASMLTEGSYGKLSAKAQEVTERIAESAKYMALSVEDYLNVSRIEAGNMKYEMSDFNLKDVAEKITDELRPVAIKKGLVMVFRSQCDGSCMVHADIGKTRQIVMNLLDNSMKYTPKGTITVVAHDEPAKKKMYITIQDTGVGMSKETQAEVFEKFVRAKNANNVNVTGTGLGLFVAKKMITDMGGKVTAESEGEGKGSTFTIEFPLLAGPATAR